MSELLFITVLSIFIAMNVLQLLNIVCGEGDLKSDSGDGKGEEQSGTGGSGERRDGKDKPEKPGDGGACSCGSVCASPAGGDGRPSGTTSGDRADTRVEPYKVILALVILSLIFITLPTITPNLHYVASVLFAGNDIIMCFFPTHDIYLDIV
jgi:hypothetical protein